MVVWCTVKGVMAGIIIIRRFVLHDVASLTNFGHLCPSAPLLLSPPLPPSLCLRQPPLFVFPPPPPPFHISATSPPSPIHNSPFLFHALPLLFPTVAYSTFHILSILALTKLPFLHSRLNSISSSELHPNQTKHTVPYLLCKICIRSRVVVLASAHPKCPTAI